VSQVDLVFRITNQKYGFYSELPHALLGIPSFQEPAYLFLKSNEQ